MSLRRLCCFMIVAAIVILPAVKTLQAYFIELDTLRFNSPRQDTEFALHDSLPHPSSSPDQHVWRLVFGPQSKVSQSTFVRAQSKNPDDLGRGKLLVASRDLADPIFAKTVVLLVHYDSDGVVGLMLNRRTDVPLSRAFSKLNAAKNRSDPVYAGGPVEISAVFALLRSKSKPESAEHILPDVYLISTKSLFEKTLSERPDSGIFHVYLGYAGWTPEQLQKEVEAGAWFIFPADAETVFNSNPGNLWPQMIRRTELKMAGLQAIFASATPK